jgi:riboflavin biosynthesis pyrimidine reductase
MTSSFVSFVARKVSAARAARLERWTSEIDRPEPDQLRIGNEWSRDMIGGDFHVSPTGAQELPATSLVFVQSRDGNTVAPNPAALGGGETDQHVIYEGLSRVAADAVMAGAETIRGGKIVLSVWRAELVELRVSLGLPRHPVQIVASLRGIDLSQGVLFNTPAIRVVIVTVASCADTMRRAIEERPWITPVVMRDSKDLPGAFREIRRLGVERVSCIGGRTIARQLIDAGLVQDLYLTTSAKEGGEPNTPLYPKPIEGRLITRKRGTGADLGVVFDHTRLA